MKVISFSLYGDSPKYIVGAAKNIVLANRHYPEWVRRWYLDSEQTKERLIQEIDKLYGPLVPRKPGETYSETDQFVIAPEQFPSVPPMLWRFMVADDPTVGRFIVRDADSRIGPREAAAVREWEQSGLLFLSLRDHWAHSRGLNGGLWGGMFRNHNWEAPKMINLWNEWVTSGRYQDYLNSGAHDPDQGFLNQMVWPWAKNSCLQFDSHTAHLWPGSKPFPTKREWPRFCGEVFDEHDNPRSGDWESVSREE
jgi:hypothetical protein